MISQFLHYVNLSMIGNLHDARVDVEGLSRDFQGTLGRQRHGPCKWGSRSKKRRIVTDCDELGPCASNVARCGCDLTEYYPQVEKTWRGWEHCKRSKRLSDHSS